MNRKGITLIELLIALAISAILIAGIYRTFITQQRSYMVQDQVVEMQQNVRVAINKMMREIRMVNFGQVAYYDEGTGNFTSRILPVNGFADVLTTNADNITIVGGFRQVRTAAGNPITVTASAGNQITLSNATDEFNGAANSYLSIGGEESFIVQNQPVGTTAVLVLDRAPTNPAGQFVFRVQAVTYSVDGSLVLRRNENTGGGGQPLADNIESLQFRYFDENGGIPATPNRTASIQVTVVARTKEPDPTYTGGGGYRRREITSRIQLRNMGKSMGIP